MSVSKPLSLMIFSIKVPVTYDLIPGMHSNLLLLSTSIFCDGLCFPLGQNIRRRPFSVGFRGNKLPVPHSP
jgi:hypothetical protein